MIASVSFFMITSASYITNSINILSYRTFCRPVQNYLFVYQFFQLCKRVNLHAFFRRDLNAVFPINTKKKQHFFIHGCGCASATGSRQSRISLQCRQSCDLFYRICADLIKIICIDLILFQYKFITGIAQGIQPLVSRNHGLKNYANIQSVMRYALITMLIFSAIIYF